jgi:hypothetical protein
MIIELRLDRNRKRLWMQHLLRTLAADGFAAQIRWQDGNPKPAGLDSLLSLERSLLRHFKTSGADAASEADFAEFASSLSKPDIVIDLTSKPAQPDPAIARWLQISFDGENGENALIQAILRGELPQIEIYDAVNGAVLERGSPSSEVAEGLGGSIDSAMARTITLLRATLNGKRRPTVLPAKPPTRHVQRAASGFVLATIAESIARSIYRLCCQTPHWRIGWRRTDKGVADRHDLSGEAWNVLANETGRVFADPFPISWKGRNFLFAEDLDFRLGRGAISVVEFGDNGPIGRMTRVLQEPWHLSYPFMIEHQGELWMIPESTSNGDVAIYRAARFPDRWERHATLLSGFEAADATVVQHNGRFYMFAATRDSEAGGYSDTLSIFHAPDLFGPWLPHASNPIFIDRAQARPAGAFIKRGGQLWRPTQDCSDGYGAALALAEVTDLTPETFSQDVRAVIQPGALWPGRKLHTLNRSGTLEVIDGTSPWPKLRMPRLPQMRPLRQPATQSHSAF